MKILLHLAAYQCEEFIDKFLEPWIELKKEQDLSISIGHVCFKENFEQGFPIKSADRTYEILSKYYSNGIINNFQFFNEPLTEIEARDKIFSPFKDCVDFIWLAAPDEIYKLTEIKSAIEYIQNEPFIETFRIEFKNLTFTEKQYTKGFRPTRIFRNTNYKINKFRGDDEVNFIKNDQIIDYTLLPQKTIPIRIINPLHYTWLDNKRSKQKIKYQEKRWNPPNGAGCSFAWDEKENKLIWNQDYFKRTGQPIPELYTINE